MTLTKAYKNQEFLMSDAARGIRILSEYQEPMWRFERSAVKRAIILFGSARIRPVDPAMSAHTPARPLAPGVSPQPHVPDYYAMASELAERLARWTLETHAVDERYFLCTGGGPGIMEAVGAGAARVDRSLNIGLNISLPFEQHVNPHVDELQAFEFHYFFMRKFWFMNLAQAFVVFPGGYGTLDELFEVLTLIQTRKSRPIPIVLFGREFWDGLIHFERLTERGLISPADAELFLMVDSVDAAFEHLVRGISRPQAPSIEGREQNASRGADGMPPPA
jgi:uncharacterized protein (TIGR00730 family)